MKIYKRDCCNTIIFCNNISCVILYGRNYHQRRNLMKSWSIIAFYLEQILRYKRRFVWYINGYMVRLICLLFCLCVNRITISVEKLKICVFSKYPDNIVLFFATSVALNVVPKKRHKQVGFQKLLLGIYVPQT